MVSTRQAELNLIKLQTWIAAINVLATVILSIASIWIAHQVNENSERQRQYEKINEERKKANSERQELLNSCLSLKLSEISQKKQADQFDTEFMSISSAINKRCKDAGLNLDTIDASNLSQDQATTLAVMAFLKWTLEKK